MLVVPAAARVSCWLNAWLTRRESADAVISALSGTQVNVEFTGIAAEPLAPALLLGVLRQRAVPRSSLALPVAGDLVGLGGPAAFNAGALEAGQAVVLHGVGLGLVPVAVGASTTWLGGPAAVPSYVADVPSAGRDLRAGLLAAAERLAELDVAAWSPDVADALLNLRAPASLDCAMSFASPPAAKLAVDGLRALEIAELALRDEGGALTAREVAERRAAVTLLHRAARVAVVAACSSVDGR